MAGRQEQGLADEELHHEVGTGRRFELHRPRLVDRLPKELRGRHRVGHALGVGRLGLGDHPLVGIENRRLDDGTPLDQSLQQRLGRGRIAQCVHALRLQGTGDALDVVQDLLLARASHRLADGTGGLVGGLGGFHDEIGEADHQHRQDDGDDHRRRDEDAAHQHQPHVQARARRATPPVEP